MKYGNKVVCSVNEYKDPMTDYDVNNMPKDLPTVENSAVRKEIIDQKVKFYVTKEAEIKDKICNMYDKIWVKCTDAFQIITSHEELYEGKELKKELICLLKMIKEISSRLDKLVNERVTY